MSVVCRVLIADDHAIVRNATRSLLEAMSGVEIVGEAEDGLAAIALAKRLQPDLLLLDVAMPHAGGLAVVGEVKRWSPQTRIAVLTGVTTKATLKQLRDTVAGVLLKTCAPQELDYGLRRIIAGGTYVAEQARAGLANEGPDTELTTRERQILSLVAQGRTNADIATMLGISVKTVDNHRTNVMRKLDVHSAAELVALAYREGLADT